MLKELPRFVPWFLAASLAIACGDDDDSTGQASGGAKSTGGATSKGGASSGGGTAKGGASSGGATSGGAATLGGSSAGGAAAGGASGGSVGQGGSGNPQGGTTPLGGSGGVGGDTAGSAGESGGGGISAGGAGGTGGEETGGNGGEGGAAPVQPDAIDNPGFEAATQGDVPPPNWSITGTITAAKTTWNTANAHAGDKYLDIWAASAYTVTTSQLVSPLPAGNYSFSIWHIGGAYTKQQIFARGYDANNASAEIHVDTTVSESAWVQVVIPSIPVTSGKVEIGVYSEATANNWSHFDDAVLTKLP